MTTTEDILTERKKYARGFYSRLCYVQCVDGVQYYALTMIAGKLVRILNGNSHETDHWQDIIGYATLGGRLELAESLDNTSEPLVDILSVVDLKPYKGDKKC